MYPVETSALGKDARVQEQEDVFLFSGDALLAIRTAGPKADPPSPNLAHSLMINPAWHKRQINLHRSEEWWFDHS